MRNHGLVWLKQHLGEACELLRLYREVAEIKNVGVIEDERVRRVDGPGYLLHVGLRSMECEA